MKKFIAFLFCASLALFSSVQASEVKLTPDTPIESVVSFDVQPEVYFDAVPVVDAVPVIDAFVIGMVPQDFTLSKQVVVPKCPFRYLYSHRYATHYSNCSPGKFIYDESQGIESVPRQVHPPLLQAGRSC